MTAIFVSGFSGTSFGEKPGVHKMADMLPQALKDKVVITKKETWTDGDSAIESVKNIINTNPKLPVVLVGHSYGGDTVVEIAQGLDKLGICVDLMIQIDSVGVGDDEKPKNVEKGVNIWSTSRKGINGEVNVKGSENIPISGTTHSDIDQPDDKGMVSNNSNSANEGKNAFALVKDFIAVLQAPYFNERKASEIALMDDCDAPFSEKVLCTIQGAGVEGLSESELQERTHIELAHLVPALKQLIDEGLITTSPGPLPMEYFKPVVPLNVYGDKKVMKDNTEAELV